MKNASECTCAQRMYEILAGYHQLTYDEYDVSEVAERYGVHRDTVYRGVRRGDPMYPDAVGIGNGVKPRLVVSVEALRASDFRRLAFYKTTPSWQKLIGLEFTKPPPRQSARSVLARLSNLPQRLHPR